jgi:hypothetical protein
MLFAVMGFFNAGADPSPPGLQVEFNEHLGQPTPRIRLAGYLRNRANERTGFLGLIEADSFDRAEAYLHASPYFQSGLYRQVEVVRFDIEVGRLA